MRITELKRRKLHHDVLDRLLMGIRAGEFAPGSLLPSERALMKAFGIGRPAVREALHSLQRIGLISIRHGVGARVQALTVRSVVAQIADAAHLLLCANPDVLDHLKSARLAFEIAIVREAASLASDADIAELRRVTDAYAAADANDFHAKGVEFHLTIVAITRNQIYIGLAGVMFDLLERFYPRRTPTREVQRKALAGHRHIAERIAARDVRGAAEAMSAHLERVQKLYSHRAERRKR